MSSQVAKAAGKAIYAAPLFTPKQPLTGPRFNLLREIAIGTTLGICAGFVWKVSLGVQLGSAAWWGGCSTAQRASRVAIDDAAAAARRVCSSSSSVDVGRIVDLCLALSLCLSLSHSVWRPSRRCQLPRERAS